MAERVLYQEAGVLVTPTRFTFRGQTIAMQGVTSVSVRQKRRPIWTALLLVLLAAPVAAAAQQISPLAAIGVVLLDVVLALVLVVRRPDDLLVVGAAGQEWVAVWGNPDRIARVREAVEQALDQR